MTTDRPFFNPFHHPYLTEGITDPSELLAYYSFKPFDFLRNKLAQPSNIFVVGRKGVGKTMLLRLFDADLVASLYRDSSNAFSAVRDRIPPAMVGVYINLASPAIRLREFAGRDQPAEWWQRAFGDFLNCIVFSELFKNLDTLCATPAWLKASNLKHSPLRDTQVVWPALNSGLKQESSLYEDLASANDLVELNSARLTSWVRYLNHDIAEPPATPLTLGIPLFKFTAAVRKLAPKFRLVIILDQYEQLYGHSSLVDFRPVCNQAMSESSRGGTGVEFKIGTRAYAYQNLNLLVGSGRIETGREVEEVNLDNLSERYFKEFVAEIFEKRLHNAGGRVEKGRARRLASSHLPGLTPRAEAERYAKNATGDSARHLAPITERWRSYGMSEDDARAVVESSGLKAAHPLTGTLVGIALTRWLRDGRRKPPAGLASAPKTADTIPKKMTHFASKLIESVERRYREGGTRSRRSSPGQRAVDDLLAAYEEVALFRIASSYKNQLKTYAGFDTLRRVSSNVALVFLQIMKTSYDLFSLTNGNPYSDPLPPEIQSSAVYQVSEIWQRSIASEYDYGVAQDVFLRHLGSSFRSIQIDITTTVPAPNGFSLSADQFDVANGDANPRDSALALIRQLVSWGLLEESLHQDKTKGRPPRRRFYLNRILCPFFKISEQHLKDPIYVKDLSQFVTDLRRGDIPEEFAEVIRASRGTAQGSQPQLF